MYMQDTHNVFCERAKKERHTQNRLQISQKQFENVIHQKEMGNICLFNFLTQQGREKKHEFFHPYAISS
jgi:hypothetical protein